jgi:hypothetical protein
MFTGIFKGLIIYIRGLLGYRRYFLGDGICSNGIDIFLHLMKYIPRNVTHKVYDYN